MSRAEERYEYQQEDAAKVVKAYKATRVEEFRALLRQEYLIQLLTMQKVEGVRDRRKAVVVTPKFVVVGDLVGIDPDHLNLVVVNAKVFSPESSFKASKMLVRGDQVQYMWLVEPSEVEGVLEGLK